MVARLSAAALAVLAMACFATLLVLGPQVGWVVEMGGGADFPVGPYDVRGELPWMTVLLAGTLVGALLSVRRPGHPIPWLLIAIGTGFLASPAGPVAVAHATADGAVPGWVAYVAWSGNWAWLVGISASVYLLLLFPDGRALTRRWRLVGQLAAGYLAVVFLLVALWPELVNAPAIPNPFGVDVLRAFAPLLDPLMACFLVLPVLAGTCVVLRFVRSSGVERQQMKWMAYGAGVAAETMHPSSLSLWLRGTESSS